MAAPQSILLRLHFRVVRGGRRRQERVAARAVYLTRTRPLLLCGQHVFRRCRVLLISLEDDRDELKRRIEAVLIHFGIDRRELKSWLFCATPTGVKLAEQRNKTRVVIVSPAGYSDVALPIGTPTILNQVGFPPVDGVADPTLQIGR